MAFSHPGVNAKWGIPKGRSMSVWLLAGTKVWEAVPVWISGCCHKPGTHGHCIARSLRPSSLLLHYINADRRKNGVVTRKRESYVCFGLTFTLVLGGLSGTI